jgi:hypothetical protein
MKNRTSRINYDQYITTQISHVNYLFTQQKLLHGLFLHKFIKLIKFRPSLVQPTVLLPSQQNKATLFYIQLVQSIFHHHKLILQLPRTLFSNWSYLMWIVHMKSPIVCAITRGRTQIRRAICIYEYVCGMEEVSPQTTARMRCV